ncbi:MULTISPECIES: hypothetical protein [Prochlorococcus]|uniref:hypothetical protein n=1 Tax=Prochlorococcus TaxID=1218 RepID=UPI000533798E|nr:MULTISPECIES: hypothetical protein [Prochlorococcus]KGG11876.1 hypothetical protein EV05_1077 [Prochlorococcus sp. MIT 0601]
MLGDRIQEIADFARGESPYRSANKGWLTDDVYLQWGATKDKSSEKFDQLVKVSFFWQPIIKAALTLISVIFFASLFAFMPLTLSQGKFKPMNELLSVSFNFVSADNQLQVDNSNMNKTKPSPEEPLVETAIEMESKVGISSKQEVRPESDQRRVNTITAVDLFQANKH